jgi:hypothetical protein
MKDGQPKSERIGSKAEPQPIPIVFTGAEEERKREAFKRTHLGIKHDDPVEAEPWFSAWMHALQISKTCEGIQDEISTSILKAVRRPLAEDERKSES